MATNALELPEGDAELIRLLSEGGDERIAIDPGTCLNRYLCAPRPSEVLAFSSTTANDLSADALLHLTKWPLVPASPAEYADRLEAIRQRIRACYGLTDATAIVFAPSGTDLEFVALSCAPRRAPILNILLGADEIGSGCIHSANGRHFADRTALGVRTTPGAPVDQSATNDITMIDIPVRHDDGRPRASQEIADAIDVRVRIARANGQHALVHIVHGSKTGLVVPALADIDRLQAQWGDVLSWVVDACQARIAPRAVQAYLARGMVVLLTGSKFMGGPPFCGFALVPEMLLAAAEPLGLGMRAIFRRGEWPAGWLGAEALPDSANPGLLLRLEAAVFELERYRRLPAARIVAIVEAFAEAVHRMVGELGIALIDAGRLATEAAPEAHTLFALDLSNLVEGADFADAQRWYRAMAERGIRLGQPVRSSKLADGRWSPTMRIAVSMPMICHVVHNVADPRAHFDRELAMVAALLARCAGVDARSHAPA